MSEPSARFQQKRGVSYLYMLAAFVVVVAGMKASAAIMNPLLLAILLSVISAPAYIKLRSRGVAEWLSLLTVIAVLSVCMFGVLFFVTRSIASFTSKQNEYQQRIAEEKRKVIRSVQKWIPEWAKSIEAKSDVASEVETEFLAEDSSSTENSPLDITEKSDTTDEEPTIDQETDLFSDNIADDTSRPSVSTVNQPVAEPDESWLEYLMAQFDPGTVISLAGTVANSLSTLLSNALLILLTVIFILLEASSFPKKMANAFHSTADAQERAQQIVNSVQHYIVIKTWVSLATGVLIGVWLYLWGVSHAPLWGLLAFLFNYIPNVGSILAAIPAVLVAWLELTWLPAVACALGFVAVNGVIGNFFEPRMMGKSLGLSPLVVFFSMIFWGWILGPIGMLLSVPLTMTARIAMDGFEDTRWIATLMGNAS